MNNRSQRIRRIVIHSIRVLLFSLTIVLVRVQHSQILADRQNQPRIPLKLDQIRPFFPAATSLAKGTSKAGREVFDSSGKSLGFVLQTTPISDHLIGFSGPTNLLIAFAHDDQIVGIDILTSGDTDEHVDEVKKDKAFLNSFVGLTWSEASAITHVDGVAGATLTSLAIQESIIFRLSGGRPSLRFPDPLTVKQAAHLFQTVDSIEADVNLSSLWHVRNDQGEEIGTILKSSPHADNVIGYQGPTDTLIGFDVNGRVIGIAIGNSYDNEEYVAYVREDAYFLSLFNDLNLEELSILDPLEAQIEGVSGATMTSLAVTDGILLAATQLRQAKAPAVADDRPTIHWTSRDLGTAAVILCGITIALTSLRGNKVIRIGFQLVLIIYLGLINGDILSQAMLFGWSQHGIPWANAGGLLLLTIAAFVTPITTRRNVYCTHLCPHGAAQHLLKDRLPWRMGIPKWLKRYLKLIPALILVWCIIVVMAELPFSLVDIEPFDAWVFRVGGWATVLIAVVGLVASLFVPMAYCRYGCPTGAMLKFLRFHSRSDRWTGQDWIAVALIAVTCSLWITT